MEYNFLKTDKELEETDNTGDIPIEKKKMCTKNSKGKSTKRIFEDIKLCIHLQAN